MNYRQPLFLCTPSLFILAGLIHAEDLSTKRTVGTVYGKEITAKEIGLTGVIDRNVPFDSRDEDRWNLMSRIMKAFGTPVLERFIKGQKLEVTADEITKFKSTMRKANERNVKQWETRLSELKKKIAATDLSDADKAKLEKEREMYERLLAGTKDIPEAPDDVAQNFIRTWKIEQELQRTYGGRVIFQQFGLEALDARKRLFEEAEKKGDIKFNDPGVRHMFYYYANMRHTSVDEKELDRPWFFRDGS